MRKTITLIASIAASVALVLFATPASATTTNYTVANGTLGASPVFTEVTQTCADTPSDGALHLHFCVHLGYYNKVRTAGSWDSLAAQLTWTCIDTQTLPQSCLSMSVGVSLKLDAAGTNPVLASWTSHCDNSSACRTQACSNDPVFCQTSASSWHQTDYYGPFDTDTSGGGSHVCPSVTADPAFVITDTVVANGTSATTTARTGDSNFLDCFSST